MGKRQLTKVDNFFSQSKIDLKNFCYPLKANLIRIFKCISLLGSVYFHILDAVLLEVFLEAFFFGQKDVMSGNQIE